MFASHGSCQSSWWWRGATTHGKTHDLRTIPDKNGQNRKQTTDSEFLLGCISASSWERGGAHHVMFRPSPQRRTSPIYSLPIPQGQSSETNEWIINAWVSLSAYLQLSGPRPVTDECFE